MPDQVTRDVAPESPSTQPEEARRAVRLSAYVVLLLMGNGLIGMFIAYRHELWRQSVFYEQFVNLELPAIAIVAGFAIWVLVLLSRSAGPDTDSGALRAEPGWMRWTGGSYAAIAVAVFAVTALGAQIVFHGYAFADDEFSGLFQGAMYARGIATTTVPPTWCPWIDGLTPTSIGIDGCTWHLGYLPIHSLIRGAFIAVHAGALMEPLLAMLSVVFLALTVRRAWPDRPLRITLSVIFFAASTQFLVMSMTAFSMTGHLFFSTLWLWLYVHPDRWAILVLPWAGVVAMAVHSPYPHMMFVAPFILSFLIQRRLFSFAYISAVYLFGLIYWYGKYKVAASGPTLAPTAAGAVGRIAAQTALHPHFDGLVSALTTTILTTWSVPIVLLCLLTAMLLWNRLDGFARWLALSLLCTVGGRALISGNQGIGWGSRYSFAILGNLAILAAIGAEFLIEALGRRKAYGLLTASVLVAVAVQLPMRAFQAEAIVRPYYLTSRWLEHIDADVVVFPSGSVRWGRQLVRNDPFLRNSPKLIDFHSINQVAVDSLKAAHPGRVYQVTGAEMLQFGLKSTARIGKFEIAK